MTEETKALVWQAIKIGTIGTIVSIPVFVWAVKKWPEPENTWKTAALLTLLGFGVKEYMLHGGEEEEEELAAYMPAPSPRGPLVYYPNVVQRSGKLTSGFTPTVF